MAGRGLDGTGGSAYDNPGRQYSQRVTALSFITESAPFDSREPWPLPTSRDLEGPGYLHLGLAVMSKKKRHYRGDICNRCGIPITCKALTGRCRSCSKMPGRVFSIPVCVDCGSIIVAGSKRCEPCQYKHRSGINHPGYKHGNKTKEARAFRNAHPLKRSGITSIGGAREQARRLLKIEGVSCYLCGETPAALVHHIDWNPLNNARSNLSAVCQKCHKRLHPKKYEHLPTPPQLIERLREAQGEAV